MLKLAVLLALTAFATPPGKPPEIPVAQQTEFFRADAVLAHLQLDLERAQVEYNAAAGAMAKTCGESYLPALTQDKKHLFCAAKPR